MYQATSAIASIYWRYIFQEQYNSKQVHQGIEIKKLPIEPFTHFGILGSGYDMRILVSSS